MVSGVVLGLRKAVQCVGLDRLDREEWPDVLWEKRRDAHIVLKDSQSFAAGHPSSVDPSPLKNV